MHLELTCPGCGNRAFLALSESGKSHACPSRDTTCVVPEPGRRVSIFTQSDKAKEIQVSDSVANQPAHLFLRILSALFIVLATLKFALAASIGAEYYSTPTALSQFSGQQSLALNSALQNLTQDSRSKIKSALAFVSILSVVECGVLP